jgi:hypothetical protein
MEGMVRHERDGRLQEYTLRDLIELCDLVVLTANSNHMEQDLLEACELRRELEREQVVLACLAGSFSHDPCATIPTCSASGSPTWPSSPVSIATALCGILWTVSRPTSAIPMRSRLCWEPGCSTGYRRTSRCLQEFHNVEAQYIKAAKNISSIFAGFGYGYHAENTGILPTLLTLLLDQCLDQASSVSMRRKDRQRLYGRQPFPLTELGYGVQRIEATLNRGGDMEKVRDHTFTQLTAIVADVRGSMMLPAFGKPTRNFQAGQILAEGMRKLGRCPNDVDEFEQWCEQAGVKKGGLEGLKASALLAPDSDQLQHPGA